MTDLSGLTLTLDRPTTTAPALIAFNARRDAARLEREAWRMGLIRKAEASERAAIESQTRPIKAVPKPRAVGDPKPHGRHQDIKLTPCPGCARMTRSAAVRADRAPDTVVRRASGFCESCAAKNSRRGKHDRGDTIKVCAGTCGRMTRPARMPKDNAPGTVPRKVHGKCSTCLTGGHLGPAPKVDPAVLVAAYVRGMSLRQVAVAHGISQATVRRHVHLSGTPFRPSGGSAPHPIGPEVDAVAADRAAGMTLGQIAIKHGLAKTTVADRLKRAEAAK